MKHNIQTKTILTAIAVGLAVSSCGDFLEPKANGEFVPKDATSMNELLLGEAYPRYDKTRMNVFTNLLDDDITASPYQQYKPSGYDANLYLAAYTWQPDMYSMMEEAGAKAAATDIYSTYYELILGANAILDYIDDVTDTEENINYVLSQAYALRGFYYLKLVNFFGQPYNYDKSALGVPLKLTSAVEENNLSRKTVGECYQQIESDLLKAEELYKTLPESKQWDSNYRTSLPMVQLLLSRMYLYMEQWDKASEYAQLVMNNSQFRLLDLNTVEAKNQYGYPKYYDYFSYTNSKETIWLYGSTTDVTSMVGDNGEDTDGNKIYAYFKASPELMSSFSTGDLRKDRYIIRSWYEETTEPTEGGGEPQSEYMPQAFGKLYVNTSSNPKSWYNPSSGQLRFGRALRLSEAYLNYAEAEAMLYQEGGGDNHRTNALDALNKLRQYRIETDAFESLTATDAADLVSLVRTERRCELCFEDFRWYDLRRWGMEPIRHEWHTDANTTLVYTLEKNDPQYTIPLPDNVLEKNSSLQQNTLGSKRVGTQK